MASRSDTNSNQEFRRKRDFWTLQAKNILYKLVQPKINVIDDKGNSGVMVKKKLEVWEEIRTLMSSLGYNYEVKQLKAQYFRYKLAQKEMQINKQKAEAEADTSPPPSNSDELEYSANGSNLKSENESETDGEAGDGRLNGSGDSNTDRIIQIAEIIDDNFDEHEMEISASSSIKRRRPIRSSSPTSLRLSRLNLAIQRRRLKQVDNEIRMATELHKRNLELKTIQMENEKQNLELIKLRLDNEKKRGQMCSCVRQYVTNYGNS